MKKFFKKIWNKLTAKKILLKEIKEMCEYNQVRIMAINEKIKSFLEEDNDTCNKVCEIIKSITASIDNISKQLENSTISVDIINKFSEFTQELKEIKNFVYNDYKVIAKKAENNEKTESYNGFYIK